MSKVLVTIISCLLILTLCTSCLTPASATALVLAPAAVGGVVGLVIGAKQKQNANEELERAKELKKNQKETAKTDENDSLTNYKDTSLVQEVEQNLPAIKETEPAITQITEEKIEKNQDLSTEDAQFVTITDADADYAQSDDNTEEFETIEFTEVEAVDQSITVDVTPVQNIDKALSLKEMIIAHENEDAIKEIQKLQSIDAVVSEGLTSLHLAAMANNDELVKYLLQNGADAEKKDADGNTALHVAVTYDAFEASQALVDGGADVFAQDVNGNMAFARGIEKDKNFYPVFIIPQVGAVRDIRGQNIVHYFIKKEDIDGTALCIERNLAVDLRDNNGDTPLALALANKQSAVSAALAAALILCEVNPIRGEFTYFENTVRTRSARQTFDDNQSALHLAVLADHPGIAEYLISCGALLDAQDISGATPLHYAVRYGKSHLVELLCSAGANPNACDSTLKTPLLITAPKESQDVIYTTLLAYGADTSVQDLFGDSVLHVATMGNMSNALVTKLINAGSLINVQNKKGVTPLAEAVALKNIDHISLYVERGGDIFASDINDNTPLTLAIRDGNVLKMLVTPANFASTDAYGSSALHIALEHSATAGSVRYLLDAGLDINGTNCYGETPLFVACKKDNYNGVKQLIKAGADVNAVDNQGNTVLHAAVRYAAEKCFKEFIANGALVDAKNHAGKTALADSARLNRINMLKTLLANGADANAQDVTGKSALMEAIQCKNPVASSLLIKAGALSTKQDIYGRNALHEAVATEELELVKLIKKTGISSLDADIYAQTPLALALKTSNKALIDVLLSSDTKTFASTKVDTTSKDRFGNSALHIAVTEHVSVDILSYLIKKGFDINAQNNNGDAPLILAITEGNNEQTKCLLEAGADLFLYNKDDNNAVTTAILKNPSVLTDMVTLRGTSCDSEGNTMLHYCAIDADAYTISVLIDYGLDPTRTNKDGFSALDIARLAERDDDVLQALTP